MLLFLQYPQKSVRVENREFRPEPCSALWVESLYIPDSGSNSQILTATFVCAFVIPLLLFYLIISMASDSPELYRHEHHRLQWNSVHMWTDIDRLWVVTLPNRMSWPNFHNMFDYILSIDVMVKLVHKINPLHVCINKSRKMKTSREIRVWVTHQCVRDKLLHETKKKNNNARVSI